MTKLMLLFGLLSAPVALIGQAQGPACEGRVATIRVSEVKSGGSKEGFLAAVAAQKAWYATKGAADDIVVSPVIQRDEKTRARSYSDKLFMTFHIRAPGMPMPKHDESYDAFVKLFRENSDIKSEYDICLPDIGKK